MNFLRNVPSELPIADTSLDSAFEIYAEFGEKSELPRTRRLSEAFPSLPICRIPSLLNQMRQVHHTVRALADRGGETTLGREYLLKELRARHPFLQGAGLDRALFLTNFYAWHEGNAA